MSALDIAVAVILGLALIVGLWRGLFRPLITWAFIVAGVAVGFGDPSVAARFAPSASWRPVMGLVVVLVFAVAGFLVARLIAPRIYRLIPGLGAIDRLGGALVSGVLAFVAIYVLLSGLVTLDRATAPIDGSGSVSSAQLSQIQHYAAANPGTSIALDPGELQSLEGKLGTSTEPAANIGQLSFVLGVLRNLHIQMVESRVAPAVFDIGNHIPVIGGSQTWPAA